MSATLHSKLSLRYLIRNVLFCLAYILRLSAKFLYADDTQVYISLSQSNAQESVSTLSDCHTDILFWMESCKLKLHPDKTDLTIIGINHK